jgi:AbrB family looped-hinge helix DNA binding protein
MPLVKVRDKAQVTLPVKVRRALDIQEGDYLQVTVEQGRVVLTPQAIVAKAPPVTLSAEGERMLEEALADVAAGKVRQHETVESLIAELHDEVGQD